MSSETSSTSTYVVPEKMRATVVKEYGSDFDKIYEYRTDVSLSLNSMDKELKPNQVLVRVAYAAVNPIDYKMAEGHYKLFIGIPSFPNVLGKDASGVIVKCGSHVSKFKVGDEVFGFKGKTFGTYGEYCLFEEYELSKKPKELPFDEAAGVPLTLLTVYQSFLKHPMLLDPKKLPESMSSVMITGGSGGCGSFAVLLAKHFFHFKTVYASCSTKNVEYVASLGADRVVDYTKEDFEHVIQKEGKGEKLDLFIDTLCEDEVTQKGTKITKDASQGGTYVLLTAPNYVEDGIFNALSYGAKMTFLSMKTFFSKSSGPYISPCLCQSDGEQLHMLIQWYLKLKNRVRLGHRFDLKDLAKAHELSRSRRAIGKIVIKVQEDSQSQ